MESCHHIVRQQRLKTARASLVLQCVCVCVFVFACVCVTLPGTEMFLRRLLHGCTLNYLDCPKRDLTTVSALSPIRLGTTPERVLYEGNILNYY